MSLGKHVITFRARNPSPSGDTDGAFSASCQTIVHVRDAEPPRVRYCPRPLTVQLPQGESSVPVSWREPLFQVKKKTLLLKMFQ